jgi:hypothetical protein
MDIPALTILKYRIGIDEFLSVGSCGERLMEGRRRRNWEEEKEKVGSSSDASPSFRDRRSNRVGQRTTTSCLRISHGIKIHHMIISHGMSSAGEV